MKASWLASKKMYYLFFYSSWMVVFLGVFMAFMVTPWFQQITAISGGEFFLRVLGGALGIAGAPAALIIFFGMAIFCIFVDRSSVGTKLLWFFFFFATACFGAAIYFFSVYRKLASPASSDGGPDLGDLSKPG
jgi:hypothetical protein